MERIEREYLADRAGLVSAALASGADDFEPPPIQERLDKFEAALVAAPKPVTARDRTNRMFLREIGGAA